MKLLGVLGCAAALVVAEPAEAALQRFAILVGVNEGDAYEEELRYAESDAKQIARILGELGGFSAENTHVLLDVRAEPLRKVLAEVDASIHRAASETLLFVYFSGHADADSLHLTGTRFRIDELRSLVSESSAEARILVIDACRSGAATRVKGGRPGPSFSVTFDNELGAKGIAILTSSAAGEESQESDRLRASFFTHYFASGLLGAADRNGDGEISLAEVFAYASKRTLAATVQTVVGPQHPTYRFDLGGREDLVLTNPGAHSRRFGALEFPQAGTYIVQAGHPDGIVVAELATDQPGGRLTLHPDNYFVTKRSVDHLLQGQVTVARGVSTPVETKSMQRMAYARVVRKGGTRHTAALSAFSTAGARSGLRNLEHSAQLSVGARLDLEMMALEVKLGIGRSAQSNAHFDSIDTLELFASLAALRAFDVAWLTLSVGIEAGLLWLRRDFISAGVPVQSSLSFLLGPMGIIEIPVWQALYARLGVAVLTSFVPARSETSQGVDTLVVGRVAGGLGVYF